VKTMISADVTAEQVVSELRDVRQRQATLAQIVERELAKLVCEAAGKVPQSFSELLRSSTPADRGQLQKLKADLVQRYGQELSARVMFLDAWKDRLMTVRPA
jgi:hypothetical protein